ncbi:helix-turn-helix domain-containing protein [Actinoplanes sp. NPDC049668]|uniref:helix-turn-helix domain-containing protein n=1 Tax=unclassified Actinoplanes TaxID=2626549 RepID=UPI0033A95F5C
MARQEKAVDPAAGPLQAFAFALRKVRIEAGSPTYRTLARTAGYSAATLSEAAGGTRKPTLDVVLAYVGACRGDTDEWRGRWHELTAELAQAPPVAGPVPPVETATVDPASPARRRPRGRYVVAAGVAAALSLAGFAVAVVPDRDDSGCPPRLDGAAFTAVSYGAGARVRDGAARDAPIARTIPSGCTIGFVGYCLGEKIHDNTGGTPDIRWFKLPDDDVIASGIVHGNPPPDLAPVRCADDRPGPIAIALTAAADPQRPDTVRLTAAGSRLDIVGFAALYHPEEPPTARRWRQVGFAEETVDRPGFGVSWPLDGVAAGPEPVLIAAVACLGGDGPTAFVDARSAGTDPRRHRYARIALSDHEQAAAARAACAYPA